MVKKINISPVLFIVSLFLIFTIINLTAARNTTHSTLAANGHAARFHVTIDGAPTSTVNNKIYATSKISDIQQSGSEETKVRPYTCFQHSFPVYIQPLTGSSNALLPETAPPRQ